jgi:putative membrane protein
MSDPRRPSAFPVNPPRSGSNKSKTAEETRQPRALPIDEHVVVTAEEVDVFDEEVLAGASPPPLPARPKRSRLGVIFIGAFSLLVSLAVGLWMDRLIRDLFARSDWLGWTAAVLAIIAGLALFTIVARELIAVARLASVEKIRIRADDAYARDDSRLARSVTTELTALLATHPDTAAGRKRLNELEGDIIDGRDLLNIAERELLAPLDRRAQKLILDAAKRVSLVTAVSPRAIVDIAYVLFETARLVRRLSELYCGRPGFLGFLRLIRSVMAHLAVTGTMALGDGLVHQIVGYGLAARLSAKLGEGVVNGMMTARIGIATISAIRPMPFNAVQRPGIGDFMKALTQFASKQEKAAEVK